MAIGRTRQRKTKKSNDWIIIHQPLRPATIARIDRQARAVSGVNPVTRIQMIRTLIEQGLNQMEASV